MNARRLAIALLALCAGSCGVLATPRAPRLAAPAATSAPAAPLARSLYVGSFAERDAALELAAANGIGELTLYGLGAALRAEPEALAGFLAAARARGVDAVAPVSGLDRVADLAAFERAHANAPFAGWVTEHEYWNVPPEERAASFEVLQEMLTAMRGAKPGGWIGCYLGYPTAEEAAWIAAHVDRVYLSVAVADPRDALDWGEGLRSHRARHGYFAGRVPIWPIVYARGDAHMRPWLEQHSLAELDAALRDALDGQLAGVALFDFGAMRGLP